MPSTTDHVDAIELIRTADLPSAERRSAERAVRTGRLERLVPGVLVHPGARAGLRPEQQHHLLVRAALPRVPPTARISHVSAAAVRGWPHLGRWPSKVHLSDGAITRTIVTARFVRHRSLDAHPLAGSFDGVPMTTPARTVVDLARTSDLAHCLPVIDHVLRHRLVTTDDLQAELIRNEHAHAKARVAIGMGSALSGSPAESLCRVRFRQLRTPPAVQQHVFARAGERRADVDFWFPEQGVVVEVDGRGKYEDPLVLDGRSTADAHWREKQREDFVRSFPEVRALVRLTWADLLDPERVRAKLRRAGVPCS